MQEILGPSIDQVLFEIMYYMELGSTGNSTIPVNLVMINGVIFAYRHNFIWTHLHHPERLIQKLYILFYSNEVIHRRTVLDDNYNTTG